MIKQYELELLNIIYGYKCNYECDGCCVGSNHIKNDVNDPDFEKTMNAIEMLPGVIKMKESDDPWQRGCITLLGGEPMMYWKTNIMPYARQIRKYFPNTNINIFSNGHLLYKHADEIIEFIDEINASISISKHVVGDMESKLGQHWQSNIFEFLNNPRIHKIHNEHYHVKNNVNANIHIYDGGDKWFTWYRVDSENKIKPYASKNPARSMRYGCASGSACSALFENRLYKCSSLASLPGLLKNLNQENDQDWEHYLNYPYVDILSVDPDKLQFFADTFGKPISQCDMCNDQPANVIRWTDRKQSNILKV